LTCTSSSHDCVTVEAMKQVEEIKQKRQSHFMMQRLRKARELERERDIKEVHRDLALIRSDAADMKNHMEESILEEVHESDTEMEAQMVEAAE
jgi:large subunit ribosomal protein L24e